MKRMLTLADLARGLERFGDRYNALDVFADDVAEMRIARQHDWQPPTWKRLKTKGDAFEVPIGGQTYFVRVFKDAGVVRLSRKPDDDNESTSTTSGAVFGALAGAAIGAAMSKKGEGLVGGLLLGMLVGAALGNAAEEEPAPQRVLTMKFDPASGEWRAYGGGLVRWMKSELSSAT